MWSAHTAGFFLFLGDVIYTIEVCPSPPNDPLGVVAKALQNLERSMISALIGGVAKIAEDDSVYVIWDDHE